MASGKVVFEAATRGGLWRFVVEDVGNGYFDATTFHRGRSVGRATSYRQDAMVLQARQEINDAARYDGIKYKVKCDCLGVVRG